MDHDHVEQHHVIHRYLTGNLSSREQDAFEDHYLDCPVCLAELERMESLHRGLEGAARETLRGAEPTPGRPTRPRRLGRWRPALAAAAALVISLPLGWLLVRNHQLQDELSRLRAPRVGAAVAYLGPLRGEAPPGLLILPEKPRSMVFVLDVGPEAEGSYRVSLWREDREEPVWSHPAAIASPEGELTVSVSTAYFTPGDYVFEIDRPDAGGASDALARFPFRAAPADETGKIEDRMK